MVLTKFRKDEVAVMTYCRSLKDVPTYPILLGMYTYLFLPPAMGELKVEKKERQEVSGRGHCTLDKQSINAFLFDFTWVKSRSDGA